jgi:hypothetical protein
MLRFSLATLFLVMAVVAVGCAALANPSQAWAEVIVAVVLLLLFAGLVAALIVQGPLRVFVIGFATVGWLYFLLTFADAVNLRDRLITTRPLNVMFTAQMRSSGDWPQSGYMDPFGRELAPPLYEPLSDDPFGAASFVAPREMQDIGHALWAMLLGCAGGIFAQVIHRATRRRIPQVEPNSPSP